MKSRLLFYECQAQPGAWVTSIVAASAPECQTLPVLLGDALSIIANLDVDDLSLHLHLDLYMPVRPPMECCVVQEVVECQAKSVAPPGHDGTFEVVTQRVRHGQMAPPCTAGPLIDQRTDVDLTRLGQRPGISPGKHLQTIEQRHHALVLRIHGLEIV